jgi:hypothetical protein
MASKMRYLALGVACSITVIGCGGGAAGNETLTESEVKGLLRTLPYRIDFRKVVIPNGADGAVAGRAYGRYKTVLNFGIALGSSPGPVPVPHAGTKESYGYPNGGFLLTDDLNLREVSGELVPTKTFKQWREAGRMEVAITDKLCRAATGEPCPI